MQELQLEAAKEQHDQQMDMAKVAVDSKQVSVDKEKNMVDMAVSAQKVQKDLAINQQDNETAAAIAAARLRQQGTAGHMINGNSLTNPKPGE
jgi:ferritin-like protein